MEIDDNFIKEYFKGKKYKLNTNLVKNYYHKTGKNFNQKIYDYIVNRYNDSESFKESLERIILNIEKRPSCPNCGKALPYKKYNAYKIFPIYCCPSCASTYLCKIGKLNTTKSVLKGKLSREKTFLEKYGYVNPGQIPSVREKVKKTCIKKYGVDNVWKAESIKCNMNYKLQTKHAFETKKKNNSFKRSKAEDNCYELLKEKFGENDIKRQYISDKYPWHCDFYIISKDIYIEYQGYYTHGKHPFNKNNKDDLEKLNNLKCKYKQYYNEHKKWPQIISIWAEKDVEKRNKAKENKLKYIEVYNIEDLKKIIINMRND